MNEHDPPSISIKVALTSTGKPNNTSTKSYDNLQQPNNDNLLFRDLHDDHIPFNRLLLTGAAGGLGKVLRERLRPYANVLRLSDIADMAPAIDDREEVVPCDLADKQAVHQLVEGVDAILHFGGVSVERPFEEILGANICGVFHIYEAARRQGVKR